MMKVVLNTLFICMFMSLTGPVLAQDSSVYTRVALWDIDRTHWGEYEESFKKHEQPVMERLLEQGVIVEWGAVEASIHSPEGYTHATWFSAVSLSNLEKALDTWVQAFESLSPEVRRRMNTDFSGKKHRDHLVFTSHRRSRPGKWSGGYLMGSGNQVKPGQGQQARELWEKYTKPILDRLYDEGVLLGYTRETEYVHTSAPGYWMTWFVTRDAQGLDRFEKAFEDLRNERTADEREAISAAFREVFESGSHRDEFWKIIGGGAK